MTTKEKAKAYDEAIMVAKSCLKEGTNPANNPLDYFIDCVCKMFPDSFPELAESEDERIRKGLIHHLKELREWKAGTMSPIKVKEHYDVWIAYLEKQKKQDKCPEYCVKSNCIDCSIYEKQKEQKSEQSKMEKEYVRTLQSLISDFLRGKQDIDREYYQKIWNWLDSRHIPEVYIPKFRVGDKVLSTKNPHLTYNIIEVGLINELGNPEYRVEILTDEHSDTPPNIKLIECQKMDSWGEFIEQKSVEWNKEDETHRAFILESLEDQIRFCKKDVEGAYYAKQIRTAQNWLKSLPTFWKPSEQEKGALRTAIHILTEERNFPKAAAHLQNILNTFEGEESRKEQKPSEEEINALNYAYCELFKRKDVGHNILGPLQKLCDKLRNYNG